MRYHLTISGSKVDRKLPIKMQLLIALYENLTRFVLPLCATLTDRPHAHVPITQSSNIVDITGVGLKQFWDLKSHLQDSSGLATAHYPETLDRIFVSSCSECCPGSYCAELRSSAHHLSSLQSGHGSKGFSTQ